MYYQRPDTAVGLYEISALLRTPISECKTMRMTTPAATAALPQSAASAVQEFTSVERSPVTVICGGTIQKVGDTYGVLVTDALPSTTAAYITAAKNMLFQIVAADSGGITAGVDIYMVDATRRVTYQGSGNSFIGKAKASPETNPVGLPAGVYVEIDFYQSEL